MTRGFETPTLDPHGTHRENWGLAHLITSSHTELFLKILSSPSPPNPNQNHLHCLYQTPPSLPPQMGQSPCCTELRKDCRCHLLLHASPCQPRAVATEYRTAPVLQMSSEQRLEVGGGTGHRPHMTQSWEPSPGRGDWKQRATVLSPTNASLRTPPLPGH